MAEPDYKGLVEFAKATCTLPAPLTHAEPCHGSWTFNHIVPCISGILTIFTLIICLSNIIRHLRNFTHPNEQRQIVRIVLTPFVFAIFNFFSIYFYDANAYLQPMAELYETIPLLGIFLLLMAYVVGPDSGNRRARLEYFSTLERCTKRGKEQKPRQGSLRWFYAHWVLVFQILPFRLGLTIATCVTHALGYPLDENHPAIRILAPITTVLWAVGTLQFFARLKPRLEARGAGIKLISFKLIVLLQIVQVPILTELLDNGTMQPSRHVSYEDWKYGLPAFIIWCEMFLFAIWFWSFSAKEYRHTDLESESRSISNRARMGFGSAALHCLNIWDILSGCLFHREILTLRRGRGRNGDARAGGAEDEDAHQGLLDLNLRSSSPLPPPAYVRTRTPN